MANEVMLSAVLPNKGQLQPGRRPIWCLLHQHGGPVRAQLASGPGLGWWVGKGSSGWVPEVFRKQTLRDSMRIRRGE